MKNLPFWKLSSWNIVSFSQAFVLHCWPGWQWWREQQALQMAHNLISQLAFVNRFIRVRVQWKGHWIPDNTWVSSYRRMVHRCECCRGSYLERRPPSRPIKNPISWPHQRIHSTRSLKRRHQGWISEICSLSKIVITFCYYQTINNVRL